MSSVSHATVRPEAEGTSSCMTSNLCGHKEASVDRLVDKIDTRKHQLIDWSTKIDIIFSVRQLPVGWRLQYNTHIDIDQIAKTKQKLRSVGRSVCPGVKFQKKRGNKHAVRVSRSKNKLQGRTGEAVYLHGCNISIKRMMGRGQHLSPPIPIPPPPLTPKKKRKT